MLDLLKQRYIQIIVAILLILSLFTIVYFYGKRAGRGEKGSAFEARQAELLKKSQESDARADMWKAKADSSEFYASKLAAELLVARKDASLKQKIYEEAYLTEQKEIADKYEQDKNFIASDMSVCDRCRDLCERANRLAQLGPEFASARCDASQCADACY